MSASIGRLCGRSVHWVVCGVERPAVSERIVEDADWAVWGLVGLAVNGGAGVPAAVDGAGKRR